MAISPTARRLAGILLLAGSTSACAQVVVIVNPKSGISALSSEQVASLYLGKTSNLPGGITQALDLPESSAAREQFYAKASGKNAVQVKAIWARLTFSGKATPPKELANAAEVKKLVASQPDVIGYIEKSAADASVKTVLSLD